MARIVINRTQKTAQFYIEYFSNGIELEMVLIPGGNFMMGAPETEEGSSDSERPQHQVTVPTFFMSKYPITQAQWKAIAAIETVNRNLKPEPSYFKGENRPVESVTWFDAVEFCERLSTKHPKRPYRLPSEAEWEYACRAGTTTPFHFGETITTDVANYCGVDEKIGETLYKGSYNAGPLGEYRKETTPVGSFEVANAFGLYDMHGNVWEWCGDHWHDNYEGAPTDGRAWLDNNDNQSCLLHGGSWYGIPVLCRSAYRFRNYPGTLLNCIGFRVASSGAAARTL
ncbi:MAG: formylglycine-generating enzyme family protein [Rhizonema sp. PD37]|nr:formylglycine-generating enzyme family protein [Rhizonema sp. PD37]